MPKSIARYLLFTFLISSILILGIILVPTGIRGFYYSVYPRNTDTYSNLTIDEEEWIGDGTVAQLDKVKALPNLSSYQSLTGSIGNAHKNALLFNGYVIVPNRYYQSFSSTYFDINEKSLPLYITTDSILNYSYVEIQKIRDSYIQNTLAGDLKVWISEYINFFNYLTPFVSTSQMRDAINNNVVTFTNAQKELDTLSVSSYFSALAVLDESLSNPENINEQILVILANKKIDNSDFFTFLTTFNDLFGIGYYDFGLSKVDTEIYNRILKNQRIDKLTELTDISPLFEEDDAILDISYYDQVFSKIEGVWATTYDMKYREDIVGQISAFELVDPRWETAKTLNSEVYIQKDSQLILDVQKYLDQISSILNQETISQDLESISQTLSLLSTCDTLTCIDENEETIVDFLKNSAGVASTSSEINSLITYALFTPNNTLAVGPVYRDVSLDTKSTSSILGVSNFNSGYDYKVKPQAKGTVRIPVLMYHNISAVPRTANRFYNGLFVSPSMFAQQMAYLKKKQYKTVTPEEFYEIFKSGKNPTQKTVMITFDDGTKGQISSAYPTLRKYGLTGVFYISSDRTIFSRGQIQRMTANGMAIESHAATHKDLARVNDKKTLTSEIITSKSKLEKISGKTVYSIAYPGCAADALTFSYVKQAGYKVAFSCGSGIDHYWKNRYFLSRVHVFSDMYTFKKALSWGL